MIAGIVKNNDEMLKKCLISKCRWSRQNGSYAFCAGKAKAMFDGIHQTSNYGEQFDKTEDTIDIILDVKKGTLEYIINDTDYGVAFNNVDTMKKYRLAVSMNCKVKHSVIQLY